MVIKVFKMFVVLSAVFLFFENYFNDIAIEVD